MKRRFRLNIQVLGAALLLLVVTLGILAFFSYKALRQEALRNAEQTLDGTMRDIDNILLGVEQSTGNIYYDLLEHLDNPDLMYTYSRELVECNPNVDGCAIVFKPGFYPGKELFMAYVHRGASAADGTMDLEISETFTDRPYTEQVWFAKPMETGWIGWIDPLKGSNTEDEPLITFCLPFSDKSGERVGVIGVDVSLNQLSKIVLAAKPSDNGYSVLLARNGSYIVHPDKEKLFSPAVYSQKDRDADPSEFEAAKAMLAGERGMKVFRRDHRDWCVFFKPYERVEWEGRASEKTGWSVAVVYPEDDIFNKYNRLLIQVVVVAVISLLLFFLLYGWIIRRQLKPLKQLAKSAQHIAEGNYNEMLPYTDRHDEIGLLQSQFEQMQHSLQKQVEGLEEETEQLHQHGDMLRVAYDKTLEADAIKSSFLHYMTHQMAASAERIDGSVTTLCNNYQDAGKAEIDGLVDNIQRKSQTMVDLLNHMAHFTDTGKEGGHD